MGQYCAGVQVPGPYCGKNAPGEIHLNIGSAQIQGVVQVAANGAPEWILDLGYWPNYYELPAGPYTGELREDIAEFSTNGDTIITFDGNGSLFFQSVSSGCVGNGVMEEAGARLEFERAADIRDQLAALKRIQAQQVVMADGARDADVFAIAGEAGEYAVSVMLIRGGRNLGTSSYFPRAALAEPHEALTSFVMSLAYRSPNSGPQEWSISTRFGGCACATNDVASVSSSPPINLALKDGILPSPAHRTVRVEQQTGVP